MPTTVLRARPVRTYLLMTVGLLLTAWALNAFLIPNRLAAGGVSGLATVLFHMARDQGVTLPVGMQMLVMNVGLLAIALRVLGWRYAVKTIYGIVALSFFIDVLAPVTPHLAGGDYLLAALYGGGLCGLGMGLVFKAGGSSGGTAIVAQILSRRLPFGQGQLLLVADAVVIVLAGLTFGAELALYGAVAVFVTGAVIDLVLEGLPIEKAVFIISDESTRIGDAIMHDLGRGATALAARGMYSGQPREMIFAVVSRTEIDDLKQIVSAIDPRALVIISDVHEAIGEGFKEMGTR
ncbi:MAG TPA: YitT family protein [Coriobacteriia bacterium]|nr:YitT family protein [Coriobacteriia bacterium]